MAHNYHNSGPHYTGGGWSASDSAYPDPSALELPSSAMGPEFGDDIDQGIFSVPPLSPGSFNPMPPPDPAVDHANGDFEPAGTLLQAMLADEDASAPIPQQLQPDLQTESPPATFPDHGMQQPSRDSSSLQTAQTTQPNEPPQTWNDHAAGDRAQPFQHQHQENPRSSPTEAFAEGDKNFASSTTLRDMANNGLLDKSYPGHLRAVQQANSVDEFLRSGGSKATTSTPSVLETATPTSLTQSDDVNSDDSSAKGGKMNQASTEKLEGRDLASADRSSTPEDTNSRLTGEEEASSGDANEVQPADSEEFIPEEATAEPSNPTADESASTQAAAGPSNSSSTIAETFDSNSFNLTYGSPEQAREHAFRRIPLAIDKDDVAQVKSNETEHVKEIMKAVVHPGVLGPEKVKRGDRNLTQEEQDEWNRWQSDSSVVVEDALANLEKPSLMEQIEAKAWLIYEEIVKVHEHGYRPSEDVDVESKCSRRLQRAVECIENYALVRENILKFMDVQEFAASPKAYGDRKINSCWTNFKKKQNKAAAGQGQPKTKTRATGIKSSIFKCNFSEEELDAMERAQSGRKKRAKKGTAKGVKKSAKKSGKVGRGAKGTAQSQSGAEEEENEDSTVLDEDENDEQSGQAADQNGDLTLSIQSLTKRSTDQGTSSRDSQVDDGDDDDLDVDAIPASTTGNKRKREHVDDAATSEPAGPKPKKTRGDFEASNSAPRRSERNRNAAIYADANATSDDASSLTATVGTGESRNADGPYAGDGEEWSEFSGGGRD